MQAWYLIHSKAQRERVARENLARQNFEVYLPLLRNRRRIAGRYQARIEPMFPRYLFVHLDDANDDWGPIRSTIGVARLVRFGACAATVPDALVAALREREDVDGVQVLPALSFSPGDRVRIVNGPMAGYEAVLQARSGAARVIVLLEIAAHAAAVSLREDDVELVVADWRVGGARALSRHSGP